MKTMIECAIMCSLYSGQELRQEQNALVLSGGGLLNAVFTEGAPPNEKAETSITMGAANDFV